MKEINLGYWKHRIGLFNSPLKFFTSRYLSIGNVGDLFNEDVVRYLYGENIKITNNPQKPKLLLVGSIASYTNNRNDLLAGVGFKRNDEKIKKINLDQLYGLRGQLSLKKIQLDNPNLTSKFLLDPGLLVSEVLYKSIDNGQKRVGIAHTPIHNYRYKANNFEFESSFIDVDNNPKKFIDQLQRFEYLVTSSLHGYIFGRALGLKSTLYLPDEIHNEENFYKYKDFLLSIGENCTIFKQSELTKEIILASKTSRLEFCLSDFYFPTAEELISRGIATP